jgi:hypothetical protein
MNRRERLAQKKVNRIATTKFNQRVHLTITQRKCGDCKACCTVMSIDAVDSPCGEACKHLTESGCGIYKRRPEACQTWNCLWKMGLLLLDERPDKCGLVLDVTRGGPMQALVVREVWEGALEQAQGTLERLASEGHVLYIISGESRKVMGPPEKLAQFRAIAEQQPE